MSRWRGVGSFLAIVLLVFAFLRLAHLLVPAVYPRALGGPFSLDRPEEVAEYAGFSPLLPYYLPESLGTRPVNITVTRRPRPRAVLFWQGERFLYLSETLGGEMPEASAWSRPLAGRRDALTWREGRTRHLLLRQDDLWVEVRTDLDGEDAARIARTLLPVEKR